MTGMKILLILLLAINASAQAPVASSIRGIVVNRETGRAISNATVELQAAGGSPVRTTTSDEEGRFFFTRLSAGSYRMTAWRSGYAQSAYGQTGTFSPGSEFVVTASQPFDAGRIALVPTGSIAGRITGRDGQPVGNARVQAYALSYPDGERALTGVKEVLTNDLGEYRLFWLPPGEYFVGVRVPDGPMGVTVLMNPDGTDSRGLYEARAQIGPVAMTPVGSGARETEAHVATFFPGTADGARATAIQVAPGSEVANIDIAAAPVRTRRIRGVVYSGVSGRPPGATTQVRLLPIGVGPLTAYQASADPNTGAFEIPGAAPGSYVLLATVGGANGARARSSLEVRDQDIDNVSLVATPGLTLPVKVAFEGSEPVAGLRVTLRPDPFVSGLPSPNAVVPIEGQVNVMSVLAGRYRVYVYPLLNTQVTISQFAVLPPIADALKKLYVKSVRLLESDVLADGLRLDAAPAGALEIVIGSSFGRISGQVRETRAGISVVLVPNEGRGYRLDRYKTALTDGSGRFEMQGVPPGEYRIFAWPDVAPGAWMDPDFLRRHEPLATTVVVTEGASQTLDLTVLP